MPSNDLQPDASNVLFDAWLVSRAATAVLDAALEPVGLTADEFAVYSVLRSGPLTPTQLADWMSAPLTTVSSYVKRFQARGHVAREPHPDDARSYRLILTQTGIGAWEDAGALFLPVLADVNGALGASGGEVRRALRDLREALTVAREGGRRV